MRCRSIVRRIVNNVDKTDVVWFGSLGKLTDGFDTVKWDDAKWDADLLDSDTIFAKADKSSYDDGTQAVVSSLTQRLSVIKNELWYDITYGLPLIDKLTSKFDYDAYILTVVNSHPDVQAVLKFSSTKLNGRYTCDMTIQTVFGKISLQI